MQKDEIAFLYYLSLEYSQNRNRYHTKGVFSRS